MRVLSLDEYARKSELDLQFEQQPEWLALLHKHCYPDRDVHVFTDQAEENWISLPLLSHNRRFLGLKVRVLEGLTGLYSSHYLPNAESSEQLEHLLNEVLNKGSWDVLRFSAVDRDGHLHRALDSLAKQKKFTLSCCPDFEHLYLAIDKMSFDEYHAQLPSALRNTLKRRGAKLARNYEVRFDLCRESDSLPEALNAYKKIYSSSWKNAESYPDFIPELCLWAAQQGWLRLGVIYLDGQPAAAQIWFVLNGRASIFKLAYDEQYRDLSVGSLLTARMMEHAINDDRVAEIEYGKGGETYKKDWMSSCLQRVQIECYNPATLVGCMMTLRHCYLPRLRDRLINRTI